MERYAVLNEGQTYRNRNGSDYLCKQVLPGNDGTILERQPDRWTLTAHGINLYEDGTIEWDYSTGGHWLHGEPEQGAAKQSPAFTPEQAATSSNGIPNKVYVDLPQVFTPEQEARIREIIQEERAARRQTMDQYLEDTREEREARNKARMDEDFRKIFRRE